MPTKTSADVQIFTKKLIEYKKLIDTEIKSYSEAVQKTTLQQYGKNARLATDAYLDILSRPAKRIRGALVMMGYEMSGGKDIKMITQAARAIEMIHAYILVIDDIQDRSLTRRGKPAAHVALEQYHRKHELANDSKHFGLSLALNAALIGAHASNTTLANLPIDDELRLKVVSIANQTMIVTAHGQTNDIMNEVVANVTIDDVERVLAWKTARYTLTNPLHVGMVLAGADSAATNAITDYAIHAGKAYQITDDILGTFGSEFESGKSPMDDTREGKRTLLTVYALEHAKSSDKNFLIQMLGNSKLTPTEFSRCKVILEESGALAYAEQKAAEHVQKAQKALNKEAKRWGSEGVAFLRGLAEYLLTRNS